MLKQILTAIFAVCILITGGFETAKAQAYSPEQISMEFPKVSRTPVRFVNCSKACLFQADTLAAAIFLPDEKAQNIRMLSVTFHSSRAQLASALMEML